MLAGRSLPSLGAAEPAKYRRANINSPAGKRALVSYERAVTKMLALPADDPRNWYRHALIHTLDCPHGNWWFLPWHRGYLGWFEKICRDLSGDAKFALPYWDWTDQPALPPQFLTGNLNPANFALDDFAAFKAKYESAFAAYWATLTKPQLDQLAQRGTPPYTSADAVWAAIEHSPPSDPNNPSMYPDKRYVRQLNPPHTQAFGPETATAVSKPVLLDALGPENFIEFGSHPVGQHSADGTKGSSGVLEAQPHNLVHNEVGGAWKTMPQQQGIMTDFLSPSDPVFFMHHANIDRLWDVWTRKQQALGALTNNPSQFPIAPTGDDLQRWNDEPFLFYIGVDGKLVEQQKSGDYNDASWFEYDYEPGSGEIVVPKTVVPRHPLKAKTFAAKVASPLGTAVKHARASAEVPAQLQQVAGADGGLRVTAKISVDMKGAPRHLRLHVFVNAPKDASMLDPQDPHYAGTYQVFGGHGHGEGAITFTMGLTGTLERLRGLDKLDPTQPLQISVLPALDGPGGKSVSVRVTKVEIKTH